MAKSKVVTRVPYESYTVLSRSWTTGTPCSGNLSWCFCSRFGPGHRFLSSNISLISRARFNRSKSWSSGITRNHRRN